MTGWASALSQEDPFDDGIGVLGLVQEQEVGFDLRLSEGPNLEVVIVVEAHRAVIEVLQVSPRFAGEGHDVVGELSEQAVVLQAPQAGGREGGRSPCQQCGRTSSRSARLSNERHLP